jgi:hypothetical protein
VAQRFERCDETRKSKEQFYAAEAEQLVAVNLINRFCYNRLK